MYSYDEGLKVAPELTLVDFGEPGREPEPDREEPSAEEKDAAGP
jgi:hypothetical protein